MARRQTGRCGARGAEIRNQREYERRYYSKYLLVDQIGKVTMEELDDAARHVLNVKYDMGLFNDPAI